MNSHATHLLAGIVASLALVPAAQAATVGRSGGTDDPYQADNADLIYYGSSADSQLTITETAGGHQFHDSGETITPKPGCSYVDAHTAFCQDSPLGVSGKIQKIYVFGAGGNDSLTSYASIPTALDGGPGNDSLRGGSSNDTLTGDDGNDDLHGNAGVDTLDGGAGYDTLDGGTENDTLNGGTENDTLDGGPGADVINGGTGNDTVDYSLRQTGVTVSLDGAQGDDGAPGEGDSVGLDVENIDGGKGSDTLSGNSGNDHLYGGDGADHLTGGAGDDVLNGEAGNDFIYGGLGDDTLNGGSEDDLLDGGTGSDVVDGGPGAHDDALYDTRTAPVSVSLDGVRNDGEAGELDNVLTTVEDISGGSGNDTLTGDAQDNMLFGDAGNDTIDAGSGVDYLAAGPGDDILRSRDDAADTDSCGDGIDTVTADAKDLAKLCEAVALPVPPPGGTQGQGGGKKTPPPVLRAAGPVLVLGPARLRLTSSRSAIVRVRCPKAARATCRGTLRLVRGRGKHARTLGHRAFAVRAGRTTTVRIRLSASSATRIGKARHGVRIAARATAHAGSSRTRTTKRTITLLRHRGA